MTKPDDVGSVTVTFITTAVTPDAGTPFLPVTWKCNTSFGAIGRFGTPPEPIRVSKYRDGDSEW